MALLPGCLTPLLQDHLAHLGSWMPFAQAAALLTCFTCTRVSESTAQRHTETIGIAYETVQLAEVERIEQDWPEVQQGPQKLLLSADGAMVPLLKGEWAEVKTLVVGEVGEPIECAGERRVPTHSLSYFSRLSDAETFQRLTLAELHRRCLESAREVAAVSDGAEWIQGFVDYHCPTAIRILDFAHAAERVCQLGEVLLGSGHAALAVWQKRHLQLLKHSGPDELVSALRICTAEQVAEEVVSQNLAYLDKRLSQMQYPRFQAEGWPIGSGLVESANKLVVEARLKGSGMHWERASVNPMLALRNAVCNERWEEAWRQSSAQIQQAGVVRRAVQAKRVAAPEAPTSLPSALRAAVVEPPARRELPSKPAASHPWRRTNYATKARMAEVKTRAKL